MARLLPYKRRQRRANPNSGDPEDARLVQRLSDGDEAALVCVMERYGSAILGFAQRLVGDKHLAEEIYQDTMLKVWQQASQFRMDGHLRAWLFRVARNSAIDYMRKKRPIIEELGPGLPSTRHRPETEAERGWLADRLGEAVMSLPLAYREVIELRYFQQMGYQEVAQVLHIPVGTVKSRVSYALNRLTKLLHELGVDATHLDV